MSAGKPTKGGIAGVLQNMAVGAISGKQNYDAEDLKFLDELNKLNSEIDKAKIEGRYKDVAAGKEAVKDLIAEQRQAEQSGTSLLNKQATLAQTKQIADDNRKSREIIAAANLEASKAKRLQDQNQFLANLEVKHTALLNNDKDYQGMIKQKQYIELQMTVTQDETKRAKLADQLQAQQAKMASYATNKVGGGMAGAANIPPPPPGAVRETVKKS
jgi:collagenase-like PrtC family protease